MRLSYLEVCDDGHDQICYHTSIGNCPACGLIVDHKEAERRFEKTIDDLESDNQQLNDDIDAMKLIFEDVKRDYPEYVI